VVPRPIGWISSWGADGSANLAPYSYFNAVSSTPILVAVSVGRRKGDPKDTLLNLRARGSFCVNVVSEPLLEAMNATAAEVGPDVDEFELAGVERCVSERVDAPYVAECAAVLECEVFKEVDLTPSANVLIIGEVVGVRVRGSLPMLEGTMQVDSTALAPVGRMSGAEYMLLRGTRQLERP
jgi:flavin reductase (DIM6/NTAB) family NADH-FMN oxidoreductase RutF